MFLGGVITEWISWPWIFYINITIALGVLALVPGLMLAAPARRGSIDLAGALTATAGLARTVFGLVRAPEEGWGSAATPRQHGWRRGAAGTVRRHPGVAA